MRREVALHCTSGFDTTGLQCRRNIRNQVAGVSLSWNHTSGGVSLYGDLGGRRDPSCVENWKVSY